MSSFCAYAHPILHRIGVDSGMVSAGWYHTVLLRSDGSAVAIGNSSDGQCNIPALDEGLAYTQVSAGSVHTVLLRSDGSAVAIGDSRDGQCNIPSLDEGLAYTQVSAGSVHTVLLRSDGSAVAIGDSRDGQCNIPALDEGLAYTQVSAGRNLFIQCFCAVMEVLLPSEIVAMDNATSQPWMRD